MLHDQLVLVIVEFAEFILGVFGMVFFNFQLFSLVWPNRYAETQEGCRGFFWLGAFGQFPAFPRGMLDHDLARLRVSVVQRVLRLSRCSRVRIMTPLAMRTRVAGLLLDS